MKLELRWLHHQYSAALTGGNKNHWTPAVETLPLSTHTCAIRKGLPMAWSRWRLLGFPVVISPICSTLACSTDLHGLSLVPTLGAPFAWSLVEARGCFDLNSISPTHQLSSRDRMLVAELCPEFRLIWRRHIMLCRKCRARCLGI
jgi:hypothetical protein